MPPSSWAKRTGFRPKLSGETNASDSGQISLPPRPREPDAQPDLEAGRARPVPAVNGELEAGKAQLPPPPYKDQSLKKRRDSDGVPKSSGQGANGQAPASAVPADPPPQSRRPARNEEVVDVLPQNVDDDGFVNRHSHMKYELRDTPGLGEFLFGSLFTCKRVIMSLFY